MRLCRATEKGTTQVGPEPVSAPASITTRICFPPPNECVMPSVSLSRPIILLVHKMHESGIRLLRETGEVRFASGSDPQTLEREVVGAEALIIRTGGVIDGPLLDRGKGLKV